MGEVTLHRLSLVVWIIVGLLAHAYFSMYILYLKLQYTITTSPYFLASSNCTRYYLWCFLVVECPRKAELFMMDWPQCVNASPFGEYKSHATLINSDCNSAWIPLQVVFYTSCVHPKYKYVRTNLVLAGHFVLALFILIGSTAPHNICMLSFQSLIWFLPYRNSCRNETMWDNCPVGRTILSWVKIPSVCSSTWFPQN